MTREEAKEIIKEIKYKTCSRKYVTAQNEALDMAIKALEQEPKWTLCREQMPEEREWVGTKKFGTTISDEVYVTFETPEGQRFTKHIVFHNGKLGPMDQKTIDAFYKGSVPIAWMPLPEPYNAESEE